MIYKHQNDVIDAVDFMRASFGTEKHQEIQQELAEVYRKAEAFDSLYAEFDKGDKDLSKADFDEVYKEDK